jgi:hypothetical protein
MNASRLSPHGLSSGFSEGLQVKRDVASLITHVFGDDNMALIEVDPSPHLRDAPIVESIAANLLALETLPQMSEGLLDAIVEQLSVTLGNVRCVHEANDSYPAAERGATRLGRSDPAKPL